MQHATIQLDNASEYERLVRAGLLQASDITIVTKPNGTDQGRPVVVIAFSVQLPDGSVRQVQATTTVRLLQQVAAATIGRYGYL